MSIKYSTTERLLVIAWAISLVVQVASFIVCFDAWAKTNNVYGVKSCQCQKAE